MNRDRFLKQRQPEWQTFEKLLSTLRGQRRGQQSCEAISDLSRMYRSICYDLSMVRSREWDEQLEYYLNHLVAQGHNFLYRAPPRNAFSVVDFLVIGFPVLLRKYKVFFFVALALFGIPFLVAAIGTNIDHSIATSVVPPKDLAAASEMYSKAFYQSVDGEYAGQRSAMAGFYVFHNVGIAFKCYAHGVFFGIGTIYQLLFNGLFIGAISGHIISEGHGDNFFSFVISHGSFELTALVIAGAAGLVLAWGTIYRGERTRPESLAFFGMESVKMICGAGAMLGVAALIEGYFSPMAIPHVIKYVVGTALWVLVIGWLVLAGRGRSFSP